MQGRQLSLVSCIKHQIGAGDTTQLSIEAEILTERHWIGHGDHRVLTQFLSDRVSGKIHQLFVIESAGISVGIVNMYCISGGGLDTFCNCLDLFLNHASHTFRIRSGHAAKLDLRRDHIGRVAAMDAPQGEYCHLHRVHPAGDDLLHHHDHLGGSQHGVRCILRLRAMSPSAGDGEVEQVHGSCYGPNVEPNLSCPVGVRQHMHSIDRVHMGVFQHAFFHKLLGAAR